MVLVLLALGQGGLVAAGCAAHTEAARGPGAPRDQRAGTAQLAPLNDQENAVERARQARLQGTLDNSAPPAPNTAAACTNSSGFDNNSFGSIRTRCQ